MAQTEFEIEQRREVSCRAEKRRMTEGRQAAVADQQIKARRENHGDEDLARQVDVEFPRRQRETDQRQRQHYAACAAHAATFPNNPRGRNAITKIIGKNKITYARPGSNAVPKV